MRNIAFEVLIYMEKKQIRLNTVIQKRYTKKENNPKPSIESIKKEQYAKAILKKELKKAFISGWKKGFQYKEKEHIEYQTHGDEVI